MIETLEIDNFRCFEKTKISGFSCVNLIGGKNNSGKTMLLEALYLNNAPSTVNIRQIYLRRESMSFLKELPEKAWDNFFFNQNKTKLARIISTNEGEIVKDFELSCDDSVEEFTHIEDEELDEEDIDLLSNREDIRSTLRLKWITDEGKHLSSSLVADSKGILIKKPNTNRREVNFFPSSARSSSVRLAQEYDKADYYNRADPVLDVIKIIDNSIEQVKTLNIGSRPTLYIKRQNENLLPISLFGEALNKVIHFILTLVNNPNSILLIDEIENGLHHTNQREVWQMIFKLSTEFNAQIFATTHSWEMIEAFADIGLKAGHEDMGAYFELARHARTKRVIGIKHKLETLNYALERKMEVRGEPRFNR